MWGWFTALPGVWQVVIIAIILLAIVAISWKGRLRVSWGKDKTIGIGRDKTKRDCMKCSNELRRIYDAARRERRKSISDAEREKANLIRQNLILIERILDDKFVEVNKKRQIETDIKVYRSRLKWAVFHIAQAELERSFLENGFHLLDGEKLDNYIKKQYKVICGLIFRELTLYYDNDVINELTANLFDNLTTKLGNSSSISSIYITAKEIDNSLEKKKDKIDEKYDKDIDNFLKAV